MSIVKVGLLECCWDPYRSSPSGLITIPFSAKATRGNFRGAREIKLLEGLLALYTNRIRGFSEVAIIPVEFLGRKTSNKARINAESIKAIFTLFKGTF